MREERKTNGKLWLASTKKSTKSYILLYQHPVKLKFKLSGCDRFGFWVAGEISLFLIQNLLMPRQQYP